MDDEEIGMNVPIEEWTEITSKKQHKVKAGSAQDPTLGRVKIKPSVLKKKF